MPAAAEVRVTLCYPGIGVPAPALNQSRDAAMSDGIEEPNDELPTDPGLSLIYSLVYCSRASADVDEAAVANIIRAAQRDNPRQGITGLLVFGSGIFFQWLEGPRERVTDLMGRLRKDTRHNSIVQLSDSEEVRERLFPDWDMELVGSDDIRDVLEDALSTADDPSNISTLTSLLQELDGGQLSGLKQA